MRTATFSWLLIFDNATGFAQVKASMPETHGDGHKHVLVSSLSAREATGILRLNALTDGEAKTFLKHYLKKASDEEVARLARLLENHPLAMLQAASYINATPNMGVDAYITFFTENKKEYLSSEAEALKGQPLLSTAIKMSIDKLKEKSPQDYTMLVALSMLNTSKIESPFIEKAYAQLSQGAMAGFGNIQDVALISPMGNETYKIHDYIRDVVLMDADKEIREKAANLNAQMFLSLFPEKIEDCVGVFEKNKEIVPHIKAFLTHMDIIPADEAFATGLRLFYYEDAVLRDYSSAKVLSEKLDTLLLSQKIKDPYLKAVFKSYYGDTRVMTDGIDASIAQYRQAASFFKQADSDLARAEYVMFLANNLGYFLHYKGELEEATQCLNLAKELQGSNTDIFPRSAIDELEISLNIDKGLFKEAVVVADKELEMLAQDPVFLRVAGHFVNSLKTCALLKQAQLEDINKNQKEALLLRQQALKVGLDAFNQVKESSEGNVDTEVAARTMIYISQAQSSLGNFKDARAHAERAIELFNKHYPSESSHPRQAVAHMALGGALMGQKKYAHALKEYGRAEDIFNKISTHLVFDDMSELYHKMVIAYIAQKDQMNARRYALKHQETFSIAHPRFVDIRNREDAAF